MLGQKKNQAGDNTVRGNFAYSFQFKADPGVKAEQNQEVTEERFQESFEKLTAFIDKKFGRIHPTAKRPRIEKQ